MNYNIYIIFLLFISNSLLKAEFLIPKPNKKIYPINDFSQVLSRKEIDLLNNKLIKLNKTNSIEILVNIIDSLNGDDAAMIAAKWGYLWKIGDKKESNGIIILLSIKDRKISIQTGYGIETYLTDIKSKKIIEDIIKPNIVKGDYYLAIDNSIDAIYSIVKDVYKKKIKNKNDYKLYIIMLYILLFIIILFIFYLKNKKYYNANRNNTNIDYDPYLFLDKDLNINNEDDFDGFGGGGNFGGGGSSGSW